MKTYYSTSNDNFNGCNYFYVIYESGKKGYILKEEFLPPKFKDQQKDAFFHLVEVIGEKLYNGCSEQSMLAEIGFICDYEINSHKEEILTHTEGLCTVLASSKAKNNEDTMYLIMTINKIVDYSQVPRYDESRFTMFLNSVKDHEGYKEPVNLYLN